MPDPIVFLCFSKIKVIALDIFQGLVDVIVQEHIFPLRLLIDLGVNLRDNTHKVNYQELDGWLTRLHFQQMAQLEGALLIAPSA